jgi:uncharacterized integral membrane protein
MLATQEEMKEGKLPEESFYYSKQRNFVLIASLLIILITIVYAFLNTYHTLIDAYYKPIYTLLIRLKEQHISSDSIYFVPIIFISLLIASLIIFILIRIIYYGKQLLETKPQLQFTHEGLLTPDQEILHWKDITKLEITSSTTYSPKVHDYVIQKFLHVYFFSTAPKNFPISDLARTRRIEELVHIYNNYYKKIGDKKSSQETSPLLQFIIILLLLVIILITTIYFIQPLLLESFFRMY